MEDSKWDQPSGEISDRPVSTLFRVCLVWWPAKLPQACLGENRGFWKPSSHHTQPWSKTSAVMPEGRPRHSVWEVCKTIEIQLKGFCYVPPLNNDSLLDDPATMRDFVCQRNWDAYLEHSGTSCSQISKDKTLAEHSASTSLTLLSVRLPSSRGIGSLKVVTEVQQLGCYTLDSTSADINWTSWYGYHWTYSLLPEIVLSVWVHKGMIWHYMNYTYSLSCQEFRRLILLSYVPIK